MKNNEKRKPSVATKVMAGILAVLMAASVVFGLLYYVL